MGALGRQAETRAMLEAGPQPAPGPRHGSKSTSTCLHVVAAGLDGCVCHRARRGAQVSHGHVGHLWAGRQAGGRADRRAGRQRTLGLSVKAGGPRSRMQEGKRACGRKRDGKILVSSPAAAAAQQSSSSSPAAAAAAQQQQQEDPTLTVMD